MGLEDLLDWGGTPSSELPGIDVEGIDWIAGDGHLLDPSWQDQEADGLCAPTSAAIVLSYLTGEFHDKDAVASTAMQLGLLTAEGDGTFSGMTCMEIEKLLDHYQLDADVANGSMDQLRQLLNSGAQAIVAVDSDEVWYAGSDDADPADRGSDHALVVAGIDEARGTIVLADPGNPDGGKGYEMSIADFENAWADSHYEMVVAQTSQPFPAPVAEPSPDPAGDWTPAPTKQQAAPHQAAGTPRSGGLVGIASMAGMVIVPLLVAGRHIRRIRLAKRRSAEGRAVR
jgi:hypothetical protein